MAGKPKGDEPLTELLQIRITEKTAKRLDAVALKRSKPGAMVKRSDVAREAIGEGLEILEAKKK